jgi:hypothetical protein
MPLIKIHNIETNEIIEREMNADELTLLEINKVKDQENKVALQTKEVARQALLDKLGITADEAKLLLG